jgi:transposase
MDPETKVYLQRQRDAGKTGREALRCLKRHLARHIWRILYDASPVPTKQQTVTVGAPALMPCT